MGVAIGFLVPPILVPNSDSLEQIGDDLSIMFYAGAGYMTLLFILVIFSKSQICTFSLERNILDGK